MEIIVGLCKSIETTSQKMKNSLGEIVRLWKIEKNKGLNETQISNNLKRENQIEDEMTHQISKIGIEDQLGNNSVNSQRK